MVVVVGVITWAVTEHTTPGQPPSLAVLVDGGTEAMRTVDRLGKLATQIPIAEEIAMGEQIAAKIELSFPDIGGARGFSLAELRPYVQAVVRELIKKGRLRRPEIPYRAEVLATDTVNAFAIPGGHVYITTGMLDLLESEAELAAIMGHEIAHVDLKHCIERLQYEVVARKIGGRPAEAMVSIGYLLLSVGFSDELEAEADRQGTLYAERTGYHPQAGQLVFARLREHFADNRQHRDSVDAEISGMLADALGDYFGTHPAGDERVASFERVFREHGIDVDSGRYYIGVKNLEELTPRTTRAWESEMVSGRIYELP
jgi:predicted Zn-dependent protease